MGWRRRGLSRLSSTWGTASTILLWARSASIWRWRHGCCSFHAEAQTSSMCELRTFDWSESESSPGSSFRTSTCTACRFERLVAGDAASANGPGPDDPGRSEEHTSELQSRQYLVC